MAKTENELIALKNLVKEFLKEVQYVPFRDVDCDQHTVYNLLNEMVKAVGVKNDRWL
jgi:uncharacterized protein YaaR (DUF327 family)